MSHILDALQKVQEEKTAKLKQSSITGGVLIDPPAPQRHSEKRYLLAGVAVAVLCAAAVVAWLALKPSQPVTRGATHIASPKQPDVQIQPAPAVVPAPAQPQPAPVVTPPPVQQAVPTPPPPAAAPPQAQVQPPPAQDDEETGGSSRRRKLKQDRSGSGAAPVQPMPPTTVSTPAAKEMQPIAATAPASSATPEGIKLTGIAWHDNRRIRKAVVNDLLVGEGALVAGTKVVEIKPAMVRFEKNGTLFDVALPH